MTNNQTLCPKSLADMQSAKDGDYNTELSWVGMEQIDLPVEIEGKPITAKVNAGINLLAVESGEKGIHMSRLYLLLDTLTQQEITPLVLKDTLNAFLKSHHSQSSEASIEISGDILLSRKSLNSNLFGWKAYPLKLTAKMHRVLSLHLQVGIPYSSTCPSSAALSRQVTQLKFRQDFGKRIDRLPLEEVTRWLGESGMPATPHSQRSWAWVNIKLAADAEKIPVKKLIDVCETALGTAVQTVVKRSDEQAFAVANGQNLMFCEDAARMLKRALISENCCDAFDIRIEHQESLHPHNAVARVNWTGENNAT